MYELNQIVITKKSHVCGCNEWKIIRVGADFKLECQNCKRIILLPRYELDKKIKGIKGQKKKFKKNKKSS